MNIISFLLGSLLVLTALFLILLVLIQRGKGGGLTGALGGGGGQSAFGSKAGDVFTRFTVGVAGFWIALCLLSLNLLGQGKSPYSSDLGRDAPPVSLPQMQPTAPPPAGGGTPPAGAQSDDADAIELGPSTPADDATTGQDATPAAPGPTGEPQQGTPATPAAETPPPSPPGESQPPTTPSPAAEPPATPAADGGT